MSAYVVVDVTVTNQERYKEYVQMVGPSLEAYGGRFVVRGGTAEILEGDWMPGRFVIVEFDSVSRAKAWWASKVYEAPKALRQSASTANVIVVEGV